MLTFALGVAAGVMITLSGAILWFFYDRGTVEK